MIFLDFKDFFPVTGDLIVSSNSRKLPNCSKSLKNTKKGKTIFPLAPEPPGRGLS